MTEMHLKACRSLICGHASREPVGLATAMYQGCFPKLPKHCVTLAWYVILSKASPLLGSRIM